MPSEYEVTLEDGRRRGTHIVTAPDPKTAFLDALYSYADIQEYEFGNVRLRHNPTRYNVTGLVKGRHNPDPEESIYVQEIDPVGIFQSGGFEVLIQR